MVSSFAQWLCYGSVSCECVCNPDKNNETSECRARIGQDARGLKRLPFGVVNSSHQHLLSEKGNLVIRSMFSLSLLMSLAVCGVCSQSILRWFELENQGVVDGWELK